MVSRIFHSRIVREILGALAGMTLAGVLYVGLRQYSFIRYRGAIVEPAITVSVATGEIQNGEEQDTNAAKLQERTQKRLAAIAYRQTHPSPSAPPPVVQASSPDPGGVQPAQPQTPPQADPAPEFTTTPPVQEPSVPVPPVVMAEEAAPASPSPAQDSAPAAVQQYPQNPAVAPLPSSGPGTALAFVLAAAGGVFSVRRLRFQRLSFAAQPAVS